MIRRNAPPPFAFHGRWPPLPFMDNNHPEQRFVEAAATVSDLADQLHDKLRASSLFELAERRLAALPMTADEFAVAHRRLLNAEDYVRAGELGAAKYELRLLASVLSY